ncbi:MAG: hypothetical protein ACRC8Q_11780 [Aeromonas sp.]
MPQLILAPFLTGEAQRGDYAALKREILARIGVSSVTAAQQCHEWIYKDSEPVRSQTAQLTRLAHLWLTPESTTASKVTEKLVIDRVVVVVVEAMEFPATRDFRESDGPSLEGESRMVTQRGYLSTSGHSSSSLFP